ncbi:type 2 periplasmic-binding domain-containing protein [Rhizobium laguerreae]|uniref:hypothetical protein n=1 Tax=Rhizobium laguerreae TaxID=1076926 RepID=UPI001C90B3AB|nr:hypothetical protein [Rhizobium laguerreae]
MDISWPADIPWSLWKYQGLSVSEQVPMMGVKFAPGFLYAFAFGCIFVAFFSWRRFRTRGKNIDSSSEALREFEPTDLGGQHSLLRAYFIYAGAMLILYISLTFFGKLIFQATQMIPVAGISVDVAELKFDSPQWPLTLAFAFAGLADLLPPVRLAEEWLRNRAFRAAGIPVRLEQTTRSIIATLEEPSSRGTDGADKSAGSLSELLNRYRENWKAQIEDNDRARRLLEKRISRYEELLSLLSEIELLVVWAKTARGSWPGAEVSTRVRETESKFVAAADQLLNDFQRRLRESADPARHNTETSNARYDEYLSHVIKQATAIRFELVSLLAIFLERDPDFPEPPTAPSPDHSRPIDALADLLWQTDRPDAVGSGPEAGLLVLLIPVFILFSASAWQGVQELVSQYVETTNIAGILLTALLETLKIASLTWLPLLAAFSLRQYLWDTKDWAGVHPWTGHRRSSRLSQMMACLGLALAASLLGLTGVAMLRAFYIAQNADYFNALLFSGSIPFMLYYPTLAVTVIPLVPICLMAADARAYGKSALTYALVCASAVFLLSIAHGRFWDPAWPDACLKMSTIATAECSRRSDTLSRLILTILVFLSTWVLGRPGPSRIRLRVNYGRAGLVSSVVLAAVFAMTTPAPAREIRVGFRDDVEPFSYLVDGGDQEPRHIGYLADLCHKIFEGTHYKIQEQSVTEAERFKLVNGESVNDKAPIEVLCDAVTMRFSRSSLSANGDDGDDDDDGKRDRNQKSIYSPIVFASGVSYLDSPSRDPTTQSGDVAIGYVSATTAADVALKSCQVDHFKALAPTQRKAIYERCRFLDAAAAAKRRIQMFRRNETPRASVEKSIVKALDNAEELAGISIQPTQDVFPLPPLPSEDMAEKLVETVKALCPPIEKDGEEQITVCPTAFQLDNLAKIENAVNDPVCGSGAITAQKSWREYHFCPMESHQDLIKWFCTGKTALRHVYMGDRELILGKLESWIAKKTPCVVEQPSGAEYLTYEPYALLVNRSDPELVQFIQARVYQIFSHRATATALFASYFPKRTMSPALAYLFLLNAIDPEEGYLIPGDSRQEALTDEAARPVAADNTVDNPQ